MTSPEAHQPPFALDGTVTRDKLLELLAVQTELPWLDFKAECDLTDTHSTVELTKDIGAMMMRGGYLVVGADDSGAPVGLPSRQPGLFDEATLAAKVAKYVPGGFEVRSAVHDLDDGSGPRPVAIVWVAPHPDGWCVFTRDGDYDDDREKPRKAFQAGNVYARHGTRSEPWSQADIAGARARLIAREKDLWRAEHAEETQRALRAALQGSAVAGGPSASYTWGLDVAGFEAATVELLRRTDDIPLRRMLDAAVRAAAELVQAGGADATSELDVVLDRMTTVAALSVHLDRPAFTSLALASLLKVYAGGVAIEYAQTPVQIPAPLLWLRITERLYGLGALAVREQQWAFIRQLILAPVAGLDRDRPGRTWHRQALTEASRANLLQNAGADGRVRPLSLLLFARAAAVANPALRPDLPEAIPADYTGADPLLTSICQFDWLATVVPGVAVGATSERALFEVSYPNFAQADGSRANGIVWPVIGTPEVRSALFPGASDQQLAVVLDLADSVARRAGQSYWGWEGYENERVTHFISRNLP